MKTIFVTFAICAAAASVVVSAASAHVVIDSPKAETSSAFRAVFKVGHGCDGLPTTSMTVLVPSGINQIKPMPKAGWTLSTKTEKLAEPFEDHGKKVEVRVSEITWSGGRLEDTHYDEFVALLRTPATPGKLYFKVTQLCSDGNKSGRWDWHEVPASGKTRRDYKTPAAELDVAAKPK
jgi:uncharacterized protein YcnI